MQALSGPRHPVQARSQRTHIQLLDAAIDTLADDGYAGAKTTRIAARAGVSQGALYKHFPSKLDLFAAALKRLLTESRVQFTEGFEGDSNAETDRPGAVFQQIWEVFASRRLQAAFELYLAARTDRELAERIVPVIEHHRSQIITVALELFPDAAREHENFEGAVNALTSMMQGAAIFGALLPADHAHAETQRRAIERMVRVGFGELGREG